MKSYNISHGEQRMLLLDIRFRRASADSPRLRLPRLPQRVIRQGLRGVPQPDGQRHGEAATQAGEHI